MTATTLPQPAIGIIAMPTDANDYGDAVAFHHPVHISNEIFAYARLASVDRISLKIALEAFQRALAGGGGTGPTEATFVDQAKSLLIIGRAP